MGWHDGANRNRLLAAAADLSPAWIFFLDADERLDPSDAETLRSFVSGEALDGCAYGLRVYRMLADEHYDPVHQVAYRLFPFHPDQRLPMRRLDLMSAPRELPAFVETTLRIKHYGEVGEEGRRERVARLREADPDGYFGGWYNNLPPLSPPPHPLWKARDLGMAVLEPSPAAPAEDADLDVADLDGPVLTVAILAEAGLADAGLSTLARVVHQEVPFPVQVLLVTPASGADLSPTDEIDIITMPDGASPAAARNLALDAAGGDYILLLTAPVDLDRDVIVAVVDAHRQGVALVSGTLVSTSVNTPATAASVAGHLLDEAGTSPEQDVVATTTHVSFAREALASAGGFAEGAEDPEGLAARRMLQRGYKSAAVPELIVTRREPASAAHLVRRRFEFGRTLVSGDTSAGRSVRSIGAASVRQAAAAVRRSAAAEDRTSRRLAVAALVGAGAAATWVGAAREALATRRRA